MKVLVVYEAVPEQTYVAKVEMCSDMYDRLKVAHGYTIGCEGTQNKSAEEAVIAISWAFCSNKEHGELCETELDKELFMTMKDISMTEECSNISDIDTMIHCALLM